MLGLSLSLVFRRLIPIPIDDGGGGEDPSPTGLYCNNTTITCNNETITCNQTTYIP